MLLFLEMVPEDTMCSSKVNTAHFVKDESDSPYTYSVTDIIRMVEFWIDNIYVEFGGHVYEQTVGIPMGRQGYSSRKL